MSYSCSDFVTDCDINADAYKVPPLTAQDYERMGIDPDPEEQTESDQLRLLAERVARAFSDAQTYRDALVGIIKCGGPAAGIAREALGAT